MAKRGPRRELAALKRAVAELEKKFLRTHLAAPLLRGPSRAEILDVAAYVVLVHGALENFVEGVALWLLSRSVDNCTMRKRATKCTASLLLYEAAAPAEPTTRSVYDNVRLALDDAKNRNSK